MGGFLGIGEGAEARALKEQNRLKEMEAEKARREAEIRLAEKKARKGQETANIKLGTKDKPEEEEVSSGRTGSTPSSSLAIGGSKKNKTGIQL